MTHAELLGPPRLPPGPRLPVAVQGVAMLLAKRGLLHALRRRYGAAFTMRLPVFGDVLVISDPDLVKRLFTTSPDVAGQVQPNLGRLLGRGSVFSLDGDAHRARRKLLAPPFHGRRLRAYEEMIEEETLREAETWPQGREFETLTPFMRITLNVILRAVFGAEGAQLDALRRLLPSMVELGSKIAAVPMGQADLGRWSPGARFRAYRRDYDAVVRSLIARAQADPRLEERGDVLAMLLQSRYEDGEAMTPRDVADELLTLLTAGHETTATTLAWTVERLRRHPTLLRRLVDEADQGGSRLRQATILEVQRTRPVIALAGRRVNAPALELGEWVVPRGHSVFVAIDLVHSDERVFPDAGRFDPDRFVTAGPDSYAWIPFGGGTRRCVGAAFANLELHVVLRTLLREFELEPTDAPGERWHSRGVAFAPAKRGRAVVHRRAMPAPDGIYQAGRPLETGRPAW
jgi:cytochrome P450